MYIKIMQLVFYLSTFSTSCMSHLLYLMFRCDGKFGFKGCLGSKHTKCSSIDRYDQSCCPARQLSVSEQGRPLPCAACLARNVCSLHPHCHKAVVIIKSTERPLHISETPIIKPPLLTGTHHRPCQSYLRSKTNEERTSQNKQIKTSEI